MTKKLKLTIIIVSSVVLLLGIGLTIYFVNNDDRDLDDIKATNTSNNPPISYISDLTECKDSNDLIKRYCDADGSELKVEVYAPAGHLLNYYYYGYDDEGNLIRADWYDADGNFIDNAVYDESNLLE